MHNMLLPLINLSFFNVGIVSNGEILPHTPFSKMKDKNYSFFYPSHILKRN